MKIHNHIPSNKTFIFYGILIEKIKKYGGGIILFHYFILLTTSTYAQPKMLNGCIVTHWGDSVSGEIKNKDYFNSLSKVKLVTDYNTLKFSKKDIRAMYLNNDKYITSGDDLGIRYFYKKDIEGEINLYTRGNKVYVSVYDSDINNIRLKPALKLCCNDYPNFKEEVSHITKSNIHNFVVEYNKWKSENSNSQSYFEKNIHIKKTVNVKLSFLLPGAGLEIGLSEYFSINTMIKSEFGYSGTQGFIINPFIDNQIRYYNDVLKRKENNKRTYKYNGNYFCLVHGYFLLDKSSFIGLEYGFQRVSGKNWYVDLGIGAAKWLTNDDFTFLYDLDFGYCF